MKISLVTATWNSEKFINDAIASVNHQTYENIQHIFVDGRSTDDTLEIIKKESIRDNLIISEKDNGIYHALNKGISNASGDIVGFVHSDDFLTVNTIIDDVIKAFKSRSNPDIVYGDLEYVDKDNPSKVIRKWKSGEFSKMNFKHGWMPPHPSFFMKKKSYDKYGLFNCKYKISADYESILRYMFMNRQEVIYLPKSITKMRLGGISNRNIGTIIKKMSEDLEIMQLHKLPPVKTLLLKNFTKINQYFVSN